ncbi:MULTISPECIES: cyclodeaminase/cyclohydrolase family protein [Collinsella]|uniref:cyclodeaminase/cyclohydrolase family protein n=1 Tax=Collinsella TaxID=102106 RepID=UPI000B3A5B4A|nr:MULTISPECIES: cyclodeaminase/cyclohydrolase family protein [Collinsella]MBM6907030.1 cyclodeaminase/cyclohydrolase family protein [Collinsella intestinalis]MBM6941767.1 cyclodeaminase/cyclohydrolase family protein [Collinsella intestinalis]MDM8163813.1 cyclodeaminase/cyclohydrolase family protein [Collinsella intestinalis]OUO65203.1 sugar ABC transporter substrate-binding protein [Collinsella sp. An268]
MTEHLTDLSCDAFTRALAAKVPAPGGGGAAALAGALAVALCSMAGNFTAGKPRFAAVESDVQRILAEGEGLRARLVALVEADAHAFEPLAQAYRIPADDPSRTARIEDALRGACSVPIEIMRACARSLDLLEEMGEKGSRMMRSDVGCGAALAAGALRAAHLTVLVNTTSLAGDPVAEALEAEADGLLAAYIPRADALAAAVADAIRKGA